MPATPTTRAIASRVRHMTQRRPRVMHVSMQPVCYHSFTAVHVRARQAAPSCITAGNVALARTQLSNAYSMNSLWPFLACLNNSKHMCSLLVCLHLQKVHSATSRAWTHTRHVKRQHTVCSPITNVQTDLSRHTNTNLHESIWHLEHVVHPLRAANDRHSKLIYNEVHIHAHPHA